MSEPIIHGKYDKLVAIEMLRDSPFQTNEHTPEQIERLAKIIKYQGVRRAATVSNQTGCLVTGHGLRDAFKLNKWTHLPIDYQDFEDEDQERAQVTSDNSIAAWASINLKKVNTHVGDFDPSFDIDLLGIKDFTIDVADKHEGEGDEDAIPDAPPDPKSKFGDLWSLGGHKVLCGDSTNMANVERLMGGERAELCFTSPPYSDQRDYSGGLVLDPKHLAQCLQSPCDIFAVNLGYQRKDGAVFPYWNDWIEQAHKAGLKLLSWNIWDRQHAFSIGQMTAMFPIEHEWIFIFGKEVKELKRTVENKSAGTINDHRGTRQSDGTVKKQRDMEIRSHRPIGTVTRVFPHMSRKEGIDHPAMFPVALPELYVEALVGLKQIVFEPFLGSGTTLIACEKTNRKCFGMEIDPHYIDVIIMRWQKYTGKKAIREDGTPFDLLD